MALLFKDPRQLANVQASLQTLNVSSLQKYQNVLVQLTLDGQPQTVVDRFKDVLASLRRLSKQIDRYFRDGCVCPGEG